MEICVEEEWEIHPLRPVASPSCRLRLILLALSAGMGFVVPERLSQQDLTMIQLCLIVAASCWVASSARTFVLSLLAVDRVLLLPLLLGDLVSGVALASGLVQRVAGWYRLPHLLMEATANPKFVVLVWAEGLFEEALVRRDRTRASQG